MLSFSSILENWQKFEWGLNLLLKILNPLKFKLSPSVYGIIRDKIDIPRQAYIY